MLSCIAARRRVSDCQSVVRALLRSTNRDI